MHEIPSKQALSLKLGIIQVNWGFCTKFYLTSLPLKLGIIENCCNGYMHMPFFLPQSTKNMHHNPINGHHACPRVCREGPLLIQLSTKNRQRFNLNLTEPQNRNLKRLNDLNDLVQFNSAFMLGFYNQNDFGLVWFGV